MISGLTPAAHAKSWSRLPSTGRSASRAEVSRGAFGRARSRSRFSSARRISASAFLLGAELLDARDLDLHAQDVLLRSLAHAVAGAGDAFDLLPDVLLVADEIEEVPAQEQAVVATLHRGSDAAADALGLLLDLPGLARGDVATKATLAGIGQLLARHEGQRSSSASSPRLGDQPSFV